MTAKSIADSLAKTGWNVEDCGVSRREPGISLVSFRKILGNGLDVSVSVYAQGDQFCVWSSVAADSADECQTLERTAKSLASAMLAAESLCNEWDSHVN